MDILFRVRSWNTPAVGGDFISSESSLVVQD
jgi:hypothetical protein